METRDDEEAFTLLYKAHYAAVLRYAARRLGIQQAADVAEETFTIAWRRWAELSSRQEPLPWLYVVARNLIANLDRRAKRRGEIILHVDDSPDLQPVEPDHAETVAHREAAVRIFTGLSAQDQELVRLIAWEGLDVKGASLVLGCTSATVHARLHRLRKRIERLSRFHDVTVKVAK